MRALPTLLVLLIVGCRDSESAWQIQTSPSSARLRAVRVVDDRIVWATGNLGTCLRTIDGGISWDAIIAEPYDTLDFRDVEAFDEKSACLLSIGPGSLSRIYMTDDGGATWRISFVNRDTAAFFDAMSFQDEKRGYAFSDAVNGHFLVITTIDGGASWQEVPRERLPEALPGEGGFAASGTCIASMNGRVWIGTGVNAARVLYSNDGGLHWQSAATPIDATTETAGIFSLSFQDTLNGVAVGGDYRTERTPSHNVAITKDGGVNWEPASGPLPNGFRSVVVWLSASSLLTAGPAGSDYSLDGGESWSPLDTLGFHAMSVSPEKTAVFAVGEQGLIARLHRGWLARLRLR